MTHRQHIVVEHEGRWLVGYLVPGLASIHVVRDCLTKRGATDEAARLNTAPQTVRVVASFLSEQMSLLY